MWSSLDAVGMKGRIGRRDAGKLSKHKIAFFSLSASPPAPPANAKVAETLAASFPEFDVRSIFLVDHLRRRPVAMLLGVVHALRYYAWDLLRGRKRLRYSVFRTPYMFRQLNRIAAERVRADDYVFSFQMQSIFDASLPGVNHFIYTDHTHLENKRYPDFGDQGLYAEAWIDCEREIYRNASLIFCRSSNIAHSLVEDYSCDPAKVLCVYAGSNVEIAGTDPSVHGREAKHILFVGMDWERKGGPTLLAAFSKVLTTHPDATLSIVGCSPEIGNLPRCNVFGRVPLDVVRAHFAKASVFCLPTRLEPFGIVFVEAMAHGLPIVATNVGAVPDMVVDGENGFLVPPNDPDALAGRLIELLNSPESAQCLGARGRKLASEKYNWNAVGQRMRAGIEPFVPDNS